MDFAHQSPLGTLTSNPKTNRAPNLRIENRGLSLPLVFGFVLSRSQPVRDAEYTYGRSVSRLPTRSTLCFPRS